MNEITCFECGKKRYINPRYEMRGDKHFCSMECLQIYRKKNPYSKPNFNAQRKIKEFGRIRMEVYNNERI
jgi:hypothetical protein